MKPPALPMPAPSAIAAVVTLAALTDAAAPPTPRAPACWPAPVPAPE